MISSSRFIDMSEASYHIIIFFFLLQISGTIASDKDVLLELKSFLQSTNRVNQGRYARWEETDQTPCSWHGITCNSLHQVTGLYLNDSIIAGKIFMNFSKLTHLTHLDLSSNTIDGLIPFDLNKCANLQYLNLSHNLISGQLNLFNLTRLKILDLTLNRFDGELSPYFPSLCTSLVTLNVSINNFTDRVTGLFDKCLKLKHLDLSSNQFYGEIWRGFEKLEEFSVAENNLTGVIGPETFSSNCSLQALDLSANALSGMFPNTISNCKNLTVVNLWGNFFNGVIPHGLGLLSSLNALFLGNNSFDREIPETLLDCKKLIFIDLSRNNYSGKIQPIFGKFSSLRFLLLHSNFYDDGIESSGILTLPNLERLDLSFNNLFGQLPLQISKMPKLKYLVLAHNNFSGNIPSEFGSITSLQALDLSFNKISGNIPKSIGNLTSLLWLMLASNQLTGNIPSEIGNCKSLLWLNLANNSLSGEIPTSVSQIGSDPEPTFERNRIDDISMPAGSGECLAMKRWIPASYPPFSFIYTVMTRKNCRDMWNKLLKGYGIFPICGNNSSRISVLKISGYLQLSSNELSGTIPNEMGKMRHISLFHVDTNKLYGNLPEEIANLPLVVLNISNNSLSGKIPKAIGNLKCLQSLDISYNNFSGEFMDSLNQISDLDLFNASYNPLLSGMVPISGQIATFGPESYIGDPLVQFMAGNRRTGAPKVEHSRSRSMAATGWILLSVLVVFIIWGGSYLLILRSSNVDKSGTSRIYDEVKVFRMGNIKFSYSDIVKATNNFSDDMEIGRGGYGIVYKGILTDGRHVAVKTLQTVGSDGEREFRAEMEALAGRTGFGWPHPNLIVLYGWCLFGAEKLLVYEYMEGGTLEDVISDWVHFSWEKRLDAAVDVANALVFLHHECDPVVVHRDVKASNVLLDREGKAKVTDFGLARMVGVGESHLSTMVAGTVGYVAPEYGITGRITTKGDVYSFGVLLMELATGRGTVDVDMEECLVEWVRRIGVREVVESVVMVKEAKRVIEMWGVMKIALWCTSDNPSMRPDMMEVMAMLRSIRFKYDSSSSSSSSSRSSIEKH